MLNKFLHNKYFDFEWILRGLYLYLYIFLQRKYTSYLTFNEFIFADNYKLDYLLCMIRNIFYLSFIYRFRVNKSKKELSLNSREGSMYMEINLIN